jgi:tRNA (cmo5U34)-methyltransferase
MATDTLFEHRDASVGTFRFDEAVARVFPDMIQRSVPGYRDIIAMTGVLAGEFATPGSRLYDLGCSLGASLMAMRHAVEGRRCELIGIDNAPAMLNRARALLDEDSATTPVTLLEADVCETGLQPASMMVMNFTLQFIPPEARQALLDKVARNLQPGGILVLSEKINFDDPLKQARMIQLHHAFKGANGYSKLEISRKRMAIEHVLRPETLVQHHDRLMQAGFAEVQVWYQAFNFVSLLAFRA